jgi:MFS transporter, DHA2 family, multidrug resistance protein
LNPAAPTTPDQLPKQTKFLIFGVMAFGQFMALIDIQIVAASLNDVQAGLSAGPDEISWVQTAYLMAELVMIPFSAFLAQALSTRVLFALSAGLFTLASALCGAAWDINSMIAFRAVQGFVGGAMVPTVFATGYALFTGKDRAMIPAILGMVSVLAPTLGPTVGGYITDAIGWRWIFYINVVPGVAVCLLSLLVIRHVDQPNPAMLGRIDYSHLTALAVMLGGLEYVLEEGQRHDWFSDPGIAIAGWASFVALLLFLERSFRAGGPIVRLTPFRKPTFAMACVFNLVLGFGVYASNYLIPVYLGRVRGYDSLQIGTTVFATGVFQVMSVPIAARLSQRVDPRFLISFGMPLFALSQWISSYVTPEWGFMQWLLPQAIRGFSMMLCIVPSVTLALGSFAGPELRYASGLFNLMRNLGGAIGIALVNVWLYDQTRIHAERMGEAMDVNGRPTGAVVTGLMRQMQSATPDPVHALALAQGEFARLVGRATLTLGFQEVFRLTAWLFLSSLVLIPFCRPAKPAAGSAPPEAH